LASKYFLPKRKNGNVSKVLSVNFTMNEKVLGTTRRGGTRWQFFVFPGGEVLPIMTYKEKLRLKEVPSSL